MSSAPDTPTSNRMPPQLAVPPLNFSFSKPELTSAAATTSVTGHPTTSMASSGAPHLGLQPMPAALDQYRIQLYNYAVAERLRFAAGTHPASAAAAAAFINPYAGQVAAAAALSAAQLGRSGSTSSNSATSNGTSPSDLSSFFFTYAAAKFQQQQHLQQQQQQHQQQQHQHQQQQQQGQHCDPRLFHHHPASILRGTHPVAMVEEPKPQHSYIGLIAMAILSSADKKLVLSDIYQYILDNYAYFRSRGPGWRNSIRHNLSLNDCFIKAGRSANGKGHYWAIHPANIEDFTKGDFRRRKAQRKVRKHMGLAVDEEDSPTPPPSPVTAHHVAASLAAGWTLGHHHHPHHHHPGGVDMTGIHQHQQHRSLMMEHHHSVLMMAAAAAASASGGPIPHMTSLSPSASSDDGQQLGHVSHPPAGVVSAPRKRLFDVASLLGNRNDPPTSTRSEPEFDQRQEEDGRSSGAGSSHQDLNDSATSQKRIKMELDEDVDVVSEDSEEDDHLRRLGSTSPPQSSPQQNRCPSHAEEEPAKSSASSLGLGESVSPANVPSSPMELAAAAAAAAGLWRFNQSVLRPAVPPQRMNNGHHFAAGQQVGFFQQQSPLHHSVPSGMEQLTKYYEQVAEVMRMNCLQQQRSDPVTNGKSSTSTLPAKHSV